MRPDVELNTISQTIATSLTSFEQVMARENNNCRRIEEDLESMEENTLINSTAYMKAYIPDLKNDAT